MDYGLAQLKKIRLHRGWLLNPPKAPPTREEYGLPGVSTLNREVRDRIERAVADQIRAYGIDDLDLPKPTRIQLTERMQRFMMDCLDNREGTFEETLRGVATRALHLPPEVAKALQGERRYRTAQRHWESYQSWLRQRNPARAELERRYGYDTKHAAHLLRMLESGLEIIKTGNLKVRRDNAAELVAVINGSMTFDALIARAEELEADMKEAVQHCTLPDDVDFGYLDQLLLSYVV